MPDEDLKRHLERVVGDPEYGGTRHPDQTAERWTFDGFAEACEQIVEALKDDTASLDALYLLLNRKVKSGGLQPKDIPQFRGDVRAIWEARRG